MRERDPEPEWGLLSFHRGVYAAVKTDDSCLRSDMSVVCG